MLLDVLCLFHLHFQKLHFHVIDLRHILACAVVVFKSRRKGESYRKVGHIRGNIYILLELLIMLAIKIVKDS